ncbi:hypothetical protein SLS55_004549 [Diplodia seriata]|uniref:Allergen n=1 Tax=Diplodia seriata TaxID=420778 RepID=A0A0G2EMK4_9PEZI|nr:hypothetical protein UCDDS831_g02647 [Diplodia seriata]OMP88165.1 hypothetical protein BK809_0002922 [Diplodia seriata]
MEKAKAAVSDFMSKSGHHDTTVHERVNPAVKHETVKPSRHENVTTAIDKEVHQDHYHTAVQPVHDREVLPEQHHHNLAGVEHRQFDHGNEHEVQQRLKQEAAQFKDESVRHDEHTTRSAAPQVAGEHVHHHVHETIQPVVQKETIEPHVVHTTVPIHEVHHNSAQHHSTSALPAVSMDEFRRAGGALTGREERYDGFEGEPRNIGSHGSNIGTGLGHEHGTHGHQHEHGSGLTGSGVGGAGGTALRGDHSITGDHGRGTTGRHGEHGSGAIGTAAAAGAAGTAAAQHHQHNKEREPGVGGTHFDRDGRNTTGTSTTGRGVGGAVERGLERERGTGMSPTTGSTGPTSTSGAATSGSRIPQHSTGAGRGAAGGGLTGSGVGSGVGSGIGSGRHHDDSSVPAERTTTGSSTASKPSLLDRLNPMKDTDGDGKKGIMD